jgi:hypothetical protein
MAGVVETAAIVRQRSEAVVGIVLKMESAVTAHVQ